MPRPSARALSIAIAVLLLAPLGARSQEPKAEKSAEAAPDDLAGPVKETLASEGIRISDDAGKPWIDFWPRAAVPASDQPGDPAGTVMYPFLQPGELLGAVKFLSAGHDYRDQEILEGVYTIRYGLQPVNGDHLGVSPHRDYFLLIPAADDQDVAAPSEDDLNLNSSNASGTNHPAVFMLLPVPESVKSFPAVVKDDANKRTGIALEIPVQAAGQSKAKPVAMQWVVIGLGPH